MIWGFILIVLVWSGVCGVVGLAFWMAATYDRIAVMLMRRLHIHAYPTAIGIAILLVEHPEQWSADGVRLCHKEIGSIWIANACYGLKVETSFGTWVPNAIERRIIRNAVDWRIGMYLRNRLETALRQTAIR